MAAATGALMSVGMGAAGEVLGKVGSRFFGQVAEDAEGDAAAALDEAASKVESGPSCALSFAYDTKVATPSGEKPIASVKAGDQVTAVDPKTGKSSAQTVEATSIHTDNNLVDVTLRVTNPAPTSTQAKADASANRSRLRQALAHAFGAVAAVAVATTLAAGAVMTPEATAAASTSHTEVIHTTTNHPWLTADHGWLPAGFLHLGEPVVTLSGVSATVEAVHVVPGAARMWDLTVANLHTFAVGDVQAVVHNANCGGVDFTSKAADRNVDHEYDRHGSQWGMTGNRNKVAKAAFIKRLEDHINDPDTVRIQGWFGKNTMKGSGPATHFYNPNTGMNLFADASGSFWGAWKLDPGQASSLLTHGGFW